LIANAALTDGSAADRDHLDSFAGNASQNSLNKTRAALSITTIGIGPMKANLQFLLEIRNG